MGGHVTCAGKKQNIHSKKPRNQWLLLIAIGLCFIVGTTVAVKLPAAHQAILRLKAMEEPSRKEFLYKMEFSELKKLAEELSIRIRNTKKSGSRKNKRPQPHSVWMSPADRANCEYYQGLQDAETSNKELVDDISKSIRSGALVTGATEMNDGGIQSEVAEMNGWYDRREGDDRPPQIFLNTTTGKKCPSDWQKWKGDVWYVKHDGALIYRMSKTGDWQARNGKNDTKYQTNFNTLRGDAKRSAVSSSRPPTKGWVRKNHYWRKKSERTLMNGGHYGDTDTPEMSVVSWSPPMKRKK